jgi:hypothetical protein
MRVDFDRHERQHDVKDAAQGRAFKTILIVAGGKP